MAKNPIYCDYCNAKFWSQVKLDDHSRYSCERRLAALLIDGKMVKG